MKKTLVALAVLAAAGTTSAQSSVTLFGIVDASISRYEARSVWYNNTATLRGAPSLTSGDVNRSQTALSTGGNASSRLGFRGTEDLGGGLAASFWLEAGIANDTGLGVGTGGVFAFNRRSTVSFSGPFGEIRIGRDFTPTYWNETAFDPYGTVGVGANLIATMNGNLATLRGPGSPLSPTDNDIRAGNGIGYFLPSSLGGFYGQAMYTFHENVKQSDLLGSPSKRGQYVGGRFGYANGPVDVAFGYSESIAADAIGITPAGVPTGVNFNNKIKKTSLGASYDFGGARLMGELSRVIDHRENTAPIPVLGSLTTTIDDKYSGAMLGVMVPVGVGLIKASYARVNFKNGLDAMSLLGATNLDASVNKIALGYVHNLSKRTALYATVARIHIRNGENLPVGISPITGGAPAYVSTGAGQFGYAPRSATGYDFGIRHSF